MLTSFYTFSLVWLLSIPLAAPPTAMQAVYIASNDDPVKLENPMDVRYLRQHLRPSSPRLILTPAAEKQLKRKLKTDPVVQNMYQAIQR